MENFNLKKFLVENNLTTSSRLAEEPIQEEDVYTEENAIEGQDASGQVVTHATEALKAIEEFKAANQISSNESDFNEIEAMLEEIIERLSK